MFINIESFESFFADYDVQFKRSVLRNPDKKKTLRLINDR